MFALSNPQRSPFLVATLVTMLLVAGLLFVFNQSSKLHLIGESQSSLSALPMNLAKGTDALLEQTAVHLSKMRGGESVGGFPPFKPPDDDKKYKAKVENESYSPQETNTWAKEIINFLRQVVEKNPNLTLREILQKQGLTPAQTQGYIRALQDLRITLEGMEGHGVTLETVTSFNQLMMTLGVP